MVGIAISMMGTVAMLAMLALITGMVSRRWDGFVAALRGQTLAPATPMSPPAETNVVMLRPVAQVRVSRRPPATALRLAA
jgi:hypothetical protein